MTEWSLRMLIPNRIRECSSSLKFVSFMRMNNFSSFFLLDLSHHFFVSCHQTWCLLFFFISGCSFFSTFHQSKIRLFLSEHGSHGKRGAGRNLRNLRQGKNKKIAYIPCHFSLLVAVKDVQTKSDNRGWNFFSMKEWNAMRETRSVTRGISHFATIMLPLFLLVRTLHFEILFSTSLGVLFFFF